MSDIVLSPKQLKFISDSTAKINIAHGAIRSGKTFSSLIAWANHVHTVPNPPDELLVMVGFSHDTIVRNAVLPFMSQFDGYCTLTDANRILSFRNKRIVCMGANDQGAVGKIQGPTVAGAYVDEMTLIPQNFLDMLYSRLNPPYARLYGTTNPSSPMHPIKQMIDDQDGKFIYAEHFELKDNQTLSADYIEMIDKKLYKGLWHRRFVLGEWVMAEGAIYQCFDRKRHVVRRPPTYAKQWWVGMDYGTVHPFAALLIGYNPDHHPSLWVEKEYYWDSSAMYLQKTNSQYADAVQKAFDGYPVKHWYLDPAAQAMEVELRNRKIPVQHADNDVLNGIQLVDELLSSGDLVICEGCVNLIREIEGYTWDLKSSKNGEEEPVKLRDDACVTGDTKILTVNGEIPIRDLRHSFSKELQLINYDQENYVISDDFFINAALTRKSAEIFELELEDGKKLRATGDHKILTQRGMIELQQLMLSDIVYTWDII
ncbi:phage_term_2, phage terminase, large subunit, PBSX family [uncultured Caudovirales phage]|uniref:Phage_term_2, phage terminase, large subunit, PBSX family n=1 Tax=uncultured Caudovirales phage TaxID=2100421 RepID=A0A6J5LLE1_9CAUD|nr:phage_term_2, phage terminase, large subunit, PBSX family [uncultured Caudovirales phage]